MFGFKVICWALLFIFKLRFPPGVSIATVLLRVTCIGSPHSSGTFYIYIILFDRHVTE
jgi:hypothetical protein